MRSAHTSPHYGDPRSCGTSGGSPTLCIRTRAGAAELAGALCHGVLVGRARLLVELGARARRWSPCRRRSRRDRASRRAPGRARARQLVTRSAAIRARPSSSACSLSSLSLAAGHPLAGSLARPSSTACSGRARARLVCHRAGGDRWRGELVGRLLVKGRGRRLATGSAGIVGAVELAGVLLV